MLASIDHFWKFSIFMIFIKFLLCISPLIVDIIFLYVNVIFRKINRTCIVSWLYCLTTSSTAFCIDKVHGNSCSISYIAYTNTSSRFKIHFSALMIIYHHDRRSGEYNSPSITIKQLLTKRIVVFFNNFFYHSTFR